MPGQAVHALTERQAPQIGEMDDEVRLLFTVEEAAQRLAIGRSLMYELLASGRIASIRVGRLRRVPCEALTDFVNGHTANEPKVALEAAAAASEWSTG